MKCYLLDWTVNMLIKSLYWHKNLSTGILACTTLLLAATNNENSMGWPWVRSLCVLFISPHNQMQIVGVVNIWTGILPEGTAQKQTRAFYLHQTMKERQSSAPMQKAEHCLHCFCVLVLLGWTMLSKTAAALICADCSHCICEASLQSVDCTLRIKLKSIKVHGCKTTKLSQVVFDILICTKAAPLWCFHTNGWT